MGVHPDIVSVNPLELLAGTGFLVKGLLYIVIGVLALQVVRFCRGLSQSSGTSEREIAAEAFRWPFGIGSSFWQDWP